MERAGQDQNLPIGSVLTVAEVLRDPQLLSRGYVTEGRSSTTAFLPFLETGSACRWAAAPIVPAARRAGASGVIWDTRRTTWRPCVAAGPSDDVVESRGCWMAYGLSTLAGWRRTHGYVPSCAGGR